MREITYKVTKKEVVCYEITGHIDGEQVSSATISWQEGDEKETLREAMLDDVFVSPQWRGHGIGAHLIKKVCEVTKSFGRSTLKGTFRAERFVTLFGLYVKKARGIIYGHAFAIPVDDPEGQIRNLFLKRAAHLPFKLDQ